MQRKIANDFSQNCASHMDCSQQINANNVTMIARGNAQCTIANKCVATSAADCNMDNSLQSLAPDYDVLKTDPSFVEALKSVTDEDGKPFFDRGNIDMSDTTQVMNTFAQNCSQSSSVYQSFQAGDIKLHCYDNSVAEMGNTANHSGKCVLHMLNKALDNMTEQPSSEQSEGEQSTSDNVSETEMRRMMENHKKEVNERMMRYVLTFVIASVMVFLLTKLLF